MRPALLFLNGDVMAKYAVVNKETCLVDNIIVWDGASEWSPGDGHSAIESSVASIGWSYDGENFTAPKEEPPTISDEDLASSVRIRRDQLLREVYDPGVTLALRALRMATTSAQKAYANSKISELDSYAVALQGVPEQGGFPQNIEWPEQPAP